MQLVFLRLDMINGWRELGRSEWYDKVSLTHLHR